MSLFSEIEVRNFAHARSGDKGVDCNIGVIAFTDEGFLLLQKVLTADVVAKHFKVDQVVRYEIPHLKAFNFVLCGALVNPLPIDNQGKAFAEALLALKLPISNNRPHGG